MAPQVTGPTRRRPSAARRPGAQTRHPAVALAMALPCAVLLVMLFGGWEQMATQAQAVADLIGH
ncbi:hypothetical protein OG689_08140 [Kitasatospora sp. NBC_00240]|uniref:hypothetical protein n=1 Tax=Kitasatospora sp. NBC_00240 TaxID=2903567 RepID=UPI002254D255|nr:hypothetical protein [Kitasatospora sp. NBC_00240]MCX5209251.1 hypothetical protein [Kitasatospora sp. NBC_00240]